MKVVLFCGGYGMRMRDGVTDLPKPMLPVADRPLLWHVMRYYAHFGHKDFILCLGFGARYIKEYFLDYRETASNNFVLHGGSGAIDLLGQDIDDWTITFVNTGRDTAIGERLRRVAGFLEGEELFLANYADVLTDAPLNVMIQEMCADPQYLGMLLAVRPQSAFHVVDIDGADRVSRIHTVSDMSIRANGGYFVFRREILDHIQPGQDLVEDVLAGLARQGRVRAFQHDGFWQPADTIKERALLDQMYQRGDRPWAPWGKNHLDIP